MLSGFVEGRGNNSGQIGVAGVDLNRPTIEVSQFTDTTCYTSALMKMLVWMPVDVLVPHSALELTSNMNRLIRLLQQSEFSCNIIGVDRHYFNNQQGLESLKALAHPHYLPSLYAFQEKYYGLAAASALINYLENSRRVYYAPKSLKVEFGCSSQATMLDATSALRLNLVGRSRENRSLFAAINHTCTLSGARRLRASLLEPPNDITTIICRQDAVSELISKPQVLLQAQNVLARFPAIDSLLSMCVHLSDFPTPRKDPPISSCTVSSKITGIESSSFFTRPQPDPASLLAGPPDRNDDFLTPSSDVHRGISSGMSGSHSVPGMRDLRSSAVASTSTRAQDKTADLERSSGSNVSLNALMIEKNAELRITKLIAIKHMLDLVKPLHDALRKTSAGLLKNYEEILSDRGYSELLKKMTTILHQDVCVSRGTLQMRVQKCFAIKAGINVLLDLTRRAYAEQVDDISQSVKSLANEHSLPLHVGYNKARGFFIQIPEQAVQRLPPAPRHRLHGGNSSLDWSTNTPSHLNSSQASSAALAARGDNAHEEGSDNADLPAIFIKVQRSRGFLNCTTTELVKLNERVKGSLNEVYLIADNLVCKLIHELHPEMSLFYRLSEVVSGLDLLCSLARVVVSAPPGHTFVKPVFGDTLAIHDGRHMTMDRFDASMPIGNNTFASTSQNLSVVLGPSMSGKTTYLTQVALIQILAQIGAYVPAKFAALRLTDKIFVRMGCRDDMYTNASTFTLEMREIGHIFRTVSDNSLILIDDLGLCTTDEDCFGLCFAICDALAKTRAFSFFSSSDVALARLQTLHANIEIFHFNVEKTGVVSSCHSVANESTVSRVSPNAFFTQQDTCLPTSAADFRTRYIYTYRLVKGAGEETHSVLDLIGLTALDPRLIEAIKKYHEILCRHEDRPTAEGPLRVSPVDVVSPASNPLGEAGTPIICANRAFSPLILASSVTSFSSPPSSNATKPSSKRKQPLDSSLCNLQPAGFSTPQNLPRQLKLEPLPVDVDMEVDDACDQETSCIEMKTVSPIHAGESSTASLSEAGVPVDDVNKNKQEEPCRRLKFVDHVAHKVVQQIQMVACVLSSIERVSPLEGISVASHDTQVKAAREEALNYLAFLRERYSGFLQSLNSRPSEE